MSSTFAGMEMGRQALNAFRLGMQTVGHNIANMNTEGYSRQRVNYATVTPMDLPNVGQVGQGMYAKEITRIRDEFLDFQYRSSQANLGYWEEINSLYTAIQNYISEPSASGIRSAMDTFFTDMQSLQRTPEDVSARRSLIESAHSLGDMLSNLVSNIDTYNTSINMQVQQSVDDANQMLYDIAALNKEIYHAESLGQDANDLRDQRDVILDKLSSMMDITYQEPLESDGITGEFFLTLNGRTLVQGDHVRELRAHAFYWDDQVYYDVQVAENEFDIVDNTAVVDALSTGPEGSYLLMVDRIANGKEWTIGGGDAKCLETRVVMVPEFEDGIVIRKSDSDTTDEIPRKLSFRTLITKEDSDDPESGKPVNLVVKIDWNSSSKEWRLRAEVDGEEVYDDAYNDTDDNDNTILTIENIAEFINNVIEETTIEDDEGNEETVLLDSGLSVQIDGNALIFSSGDERPLEFVDYSGMFGTTKSLRTEIDVDMRSRPMDADEALNIAGSFRIQVGTQGTRVVSKIFRESSATGLGEGVILGAGEAGERHTFRIGVSDGQVDFSATWNASTKQWVLSSDLGTSKVIPRITDEDGNVKDSVLTVEDLTNFMKETIAAGKNFVDSTALTNLSFGNGPASGTKTQFYIASGDNHLISISDVEGDLASRMGIVNDNPVITIDVTEDDSLTTIRNKINEKYQEEFGLTQPEQWIHASLQQADDKSWYLTMSSDVAGEAQRITLMGAEDGNMQVLRRLGLTRNESIGTDDITGVSIYREVAAIPYDGVANDASFMLNGVRYLSSDNKFNMARRIPAVGSTADYSAKSLTEVSEGMWFNLKEAGIANITVRHHVRNGSIKGLEETRDEFVPNLKSQIDEMAYGLVTNLNAYQYSGYGIGNDVTMTGVAFFNPLGTKANAATLLNVNDAVVADNALIGAATGRKNANGLAVSGVSGGSGDGTNASRMVNLTWDKVLGNGTMSIGGVYDAMLSQIGSEASHARLMYNTQYTVSDQIDSQRQAVSGVNLDEELMDMVILNRAFGAMSRYITAMDEMLNTIINGFGLVGR